MSKEIDDGGKFNPYVLGEKVSGITRRDWLIGKILQGVVSNPDLCDLAVAEEIGAGNGNPDKVLAFCERLADVAIARSKEKLTKQP